MLWRLSQKISNAVYIIFIYDTFSQGVPFYSIKKHYRKINVSCQILLSLRGPLISPPTSQTLQKLWHARDFQAPRKSIMAEVARWLPRGGFPSNDLRKNVTYMPETSEMIYQNLIESNFVLFTIKIPRSRVKKQFIHYVNDRLIRAGTFSKIYGLFNENMMLLSYLWAGGGVGAVVRRRGVSIAIRRRAARSPSTGVLLFWVVPVQLYVAIAARRNADSLGC